LAPKIQSQKVSRKKASKRLSHEKDTLKTLVKLPLLVVHFSKHFALLQLLRRYSFAKKLQSRTVPK